MREDTWGGRVGQSVGGVVTFAVASLSKAGARPRAAPFILAFSYPDSGRHISSSVTRARPRADGLRYVRAWIGMLQSMWSGYVLRHVQGTASAYRRP